jgi:hypothetical protein
MVPAPSDSIFICYRRDDSAGYALKLHGDLLSAVRSEVFLDIHSIHGGEDFAVVIENGLAKCSTVLVLIGPTWLNAVDNAGKRRLDDPEDQLRREVEESLRRPHLKVIPILVGGASAPPRDALPDSLKPLARKHAVELTNSRWDYDIKQLLPLVAAKRKGRRSVVGGVLVLAAVLVITVSLYVVGGDRSDPGPLPNNTSSGRDVVLPGSIGTSIEMQKGTRQFTKPGVERVGEDRPGVVTSIAVKMDPPQPDLILRTQMYGMDDTGRVDPGGPIMHSYPSEERDAASPTMLPKGIRGVRFWLDGARKKDYDVRYSLRLSDGRDSSASNGDEAGDWTPSVSSTQHQLVWLSISIVPHQ